MVGVVSRLGGVPTRSALVASGLLLGLGPLLVASDAGASTPPASAYVLSPKVARTLGFPVTLRAAKKTAATGVKGCTTVVDAVYLDKTKQTGLVSEVVNCRSSSAATGAVATVRRRFAVDTSIPVPKSLGSGAFGSSAEAPQYLLIWRTGSHIGFTAIDTDVPASTSTTSTTGVLPAITAAQKAVLGKAAVSQRAQDARLAG
jgi:hypothetical protein